MVGTLRNGLPAADLNIIENMWSVSGEEKTKLGKSGGTSLEQYRPRTCAEVVQFFFKRLHDVKKYKITFTGYYLKYI